MQYCRGTAWNSVVANYSLRVSHFILQSRVYCLVPLQALLLTFVGEYDGRLRSFFLIARSTGGNRLVLAFPPNHCKRFLLFLPLPTPLQQEEQRQQDEEQDDVESTNYALIVGFLKIWATHWLVTMITTRFSSSCLRVAPSFSYAVKYSETLVNVPDTVECLKVESTYVARIRRLKDGFNDPFRGCCRHKSRDILVSFDNCTA